MNKVSEMPGLVEDNRKHWEERVPIHAASSFYDLAAFRSGAEDIDQFQLDEIGDLTELDLAHLQCHIGLDTVA